MKFEIVVEPSVAEKEVSQLLDSKNILPKRREALQPAVETVIEAVTYGLVTIDGDGRITQQLTEKIGEIERIVYVPHVAPEVISKQLKGLKVYNQVNITAVYWKAYTGMMESTLDKLHPTDKAIAESLTFFFQ